MPLKVKRRSDSPYWQIEGTYEGIRVRETSGTTVKKQAEKKKKAIEAQIDSNTYNGKTFAEIAESYLDNGGSPRYLKKIIKEIGNEPASNIDQSLIDNKSRKVFSEYKRGPKGKPIKYKDSTIRRQWHTPIASILHYGYEAKLLPYLRIRLPKETRPAPDWADKKWFKKLFEHASPKLRSIVIFLAGTGCRISEALNLKPEDVNEEEKEAYVRTTKNGLPRTVHLTPAILKELSLDGEKVFAYKNRHEVNSELKRTCQKAKIKYLSTHKVGSHTFATNLAKMEKMDAKELTETGRWKDPKSTYFYTHHIKRESAKKADALDSLFG